MTNHLAYLYPFHTTFPKTLSHLWTPNMAIVYLRVDHITAGSVVPNDARSIASATAITLEFWIPAVAACILW